MTPCEIRGAFPTDAPMMPEYVFERSKHTFVLSIGGVDMGVGGFENAGIDHLYQAWMVPFDDLRGHEIQVVRAVRRIIRAVMNTTPLLMRIQAQVHAMDQLSYRFALACGFMAESLIVSGAPDGGDMVMLRILKGH